MMQFSFNGASASPIIPDDASANTHEIRDTEIDPTDTSLFGIEVPPTLSFDTLSDQATKYNLSESFPSIVDYRDRIRINPFSGWIESVVFSPNDLILASGGGGSTVDLWDIRTGLKIHSLSGHSDWVRTIGYSPDGSLIVSGSADNTAILWNASSGALLQTFTGHSGEVYAVDISSNGSVVVTGASDGYFKLWNASTGAELDSVYVAIGGMKSIAFSSDDKQIALCAINSFRIYDAVTRVLDSSIGGFGSISSMIVTQDWKTVAVADNNNIRIHNVTDGTSITTLFGHSGTVTGTAINSDGSLLATGSYDETVRLWDMETFSSVKNISYHSYYTSTVSFSYDDTFLASGSYDTTVGLYNLDIGRKSEPFSNYFSYGSPLSYSPDGQIIATGTHNMTVRLWNASSGDVIRSMTGHPTTVNSVDFSPDGTTLASSSSDDSVRIWNVSTGAQIDMLLGHTGDVNYVSYSPDGQMLASSSSDQTIKIWNASTGNIIDTFTGHSNIVVRHDFSPDGQILASGSHDETIIFWNVSNGNIIDTMTQHNSPIRSLSFHPDGSILASISSANSSILLWNRTAQSPFGGLFDHTNDVQSVEFGPNGILASCASDNTIKFWNISTQTEIQNFDTGSESVHSITYSPEGDKLASASWSSYIRTWTLGTLLFKLDDTQPIILANKIVNSTTSIYGTYYASWDNSPLEKLENFQLPIVPGTYGLHLLHVETYYMGVKKTQDYQFLVVLDTADYDGDLIPNDIEINVGLDELDHLDALSDLDSDGLNNLLEYIEGTTITNNDSDGDEMLDGYEFLNALDPLLNDSSGDKDFDGLSNLLESQLGSSANNTDSDQDGMSDDYEYSYQLNLLVDDSTGDIDSDGLTNLQEFQQNTNPLDRDTDQDAWRDDIDDDPVVINGPPTVTWSSVVLNLDNGLTNQTQWNWNIASTNAISMELWLNNLSTGKQNDTFVWSVSLTEGINNITARAWYNYDYNFYTKTFVVTLNTTKPIISLLNPVENEYYHSSTEDLTSISIDVKDMEGPLYYYWDSGFYQTTTSFDFQLPTTDGLHTLYLKATNKIGNSRIISYSFYTDNTKPDAEVFGLSNNIEVSGVVTITVDPSDPGEFPSDIAEVALLKAGDHIVTPQTSVFQFEWDTTDLPDGTYNIIVRVTDKAGNSLEKMFVVNVMNASDDLPVQTILIAAGGFVLLASGWQFIRWRRGKTFDSALKDLETSFDDDEGKVG
jgi:WD40 repeat protein